MNWSEIEKAAAEFKIKEQKQSELYQPQLLTREELRAEALKHEIEEMKGAKETMEKFHAREVLQSVRDEIWGEGKIFPVVGNHVITDDGAGLMTENFAGDYGLMLVSEPFPVITESWRNFGNKGKRELFLREERSFLSVGVDLEDMDLWVSYEHIYDSPKVDSGDELRRKIKQDGYREGLKNIARSKLFNVADFMSHDEEFGKFSSIFATIVNKGIKGRSLPSQLREWGNEMVSCLPSTFKYNNHLSKTEIMEWGHAIAGTPLPARLIDRLSLV